ncbi:MAG: glycosyltransferase [bacterium]
MVGAAIPEDVMEAVIKADPAPEIQTHKLSWAIIHGIESTGEVLDLLSTVAIKDYPKSDWLWSGYRKWDRGNGSDNRLIPFINILGLKQITRFLGCFAMLVRWSVAHRGQKRHVILYGLISAHLYAVRCVKWMLPIKATILVTDLPGLAASCEPWWKGRLRSIDRRMVYNAVHVADGLIVLAQQIAEHLSLKIPYIVMEGIVSGEAEKLLQLTPQQSNKGEKFIVLYAGALGRNYGIPMLLDAFSKLPAENFQLWLFGRGDMYEEIRCRAQQDSRIYLSEIVISTEELLQRTQQATVLINPRPTKEIFARYSFPSKILEYMAAGRPVISTRLLTIPEEYESYLIWLDQETPEGLADLLRQLREQPREQLDFLGRCGRDFVMEEKSIMKQGERIAAFIKFVNSCGKDEQTFIN